MKNKRPKKTKPKIIKANQILIEDLTGRPRILLDATDGTAGISITLLSKENAEVHISVNDQNHGVFSIRHPSGKTGACLAVKPDGQSGLELRDDNGSPSISLTSKGKGQQPPAIEFQTPGGKRQIS